MYTELHAHSVFSFLEGASLPEDLALQCVERGMKSMGLLDRDGVYGAPRFYLAANKISLRAHTGAEVTTSEGWRYPLLVESPEGYQNLCRLITRMKLRAKKNEGHVSANEVGEYSKGLVCLTGGDEGPLAYALAQGGIENGKKYVQELVKVFGHRNVYVELQRHLSRPEELRNQAAIEIARILKLPIVATIGVSHAAPDQREDQDVFSCFRNDRTSR